MKIIQDLSIPTDEKFRCNESLSTFGRVSFDMHMPAMNNNMPSEYTEGYV
jgi:hypothetical protein